MKRKIQLTKSEIAFRDNDRARATTRGLVAILIGIFASWGWVFICSVIWGVGEFITMRRVLIEPIANAGKNNSTDEYEAKREEMISNMTGQALVSAFLASVVVCLVAVFVKLCKMGILEIV